MSSFGIRLALISSTILTAVIGLVPGSAQAQDENAPAAKEPAAAAPADETAKPAAAEAAKPAEPPKCDCPPPCPAPPPAPPAPSADAVEWKAQSKGGMLITTGNAQSKTFTFGLNGSRKQGNNKLAVEGGLAYGTSNVPTISADASGNPIFTREQVTTTNNWASKGRYDRFITANNAAYASGQLAADKIAGKTLFGGGQAGYSRQLLKDAMNIVVAELGYDFSYERYVQQAGKTIDPVTIHSARIMVGETLSLTQETGLTASVELLLNLNKETKALNAKDGTTGVDAFKDTRVNGKLGLTTNLWKQLSFGFGFTLKYDQNPAPRPLPKNAPSGYVLPNDLAFADKVDTLTEATLIYTFF